MRWYRSIKNVFKLSNGVSYEVISSYMYNLKEHPKITECISFERYPSAKKFLLCDEDPKGEVEVKLMRELQHLRWRSFTCRNL